MASENSNNLVLLSNNIAASQIRKMSEISDWTYFTRRKGLTLSAFFVICFGVTFLGISLMVSDANSEVVEKTVEYTTDADFGGDGSNLKSTQVMADTTKGFQPGDVRYGQFEIKIDQEIKGPVYLQYKLEDFFQNHMWYMRSKDEEQLRAGNDAEMMVVKGEMEDSFCNRLTFYQDSCVYKDRFLGSSALSFPVKPALYPCGLIALSVFNDTFHLEIKEPDQKNSFTPLPIDDDASSISWKADYTKKSVNPTLPSGTGNSSKIVDPNNLHFWLLELFPPEVCEPVYFDKNQWAPLYPSWRNLNGHSIVNCQDYYAENQKCYFSKTRFSFSGQTCEDINAAEQAARGTTIDYYRSRRIKHWGLEKGSFVNWMRTAGLPTFRKLYGKIDRDLKAGTVIRVNFVDNHRVPGVKKHVMIANVSSLGGKNVFTADFALASAIGAFSLAAILLILSAQQKKSDDEKEVISWGPT